MCICVCVWHEQCFILLHAASYSNDLFLFHFAASPSAWISFRFSPHFQVELFIVAAALMSFQGGSGCIQSVYLMLPSQTPRCCLIFGFYATLARSPQFRLWPLPPTKPTPTNPFFSPISINSCWVAIAIVIERASPAHFIFPISLCHSKSAFFPSLSPSWFVPHASGFHGNSFSYRQRKSTRMGLAISRIC